MKFNKSTNTSFSNQYITHEREFFQFYDTGVYEVLFPIIPALYNQVVPKLADKSCTAKRNPGISLDIVCEKCTGRFYIVSSDGFHAMH